MHSDLCPLRERGDELMALRRAAAKASAGHPQLVVVSGLRRVGKTLLLQHLAREIRPMPVVYFEATQAGGTAELRRFSEVLQTTLGSEQLAPYPAFATWEQALQLSAHLARTRPLAVIIDEATHLMESSPGFASTVQAVWDSMAADLHGPSLMLALASSTVGAVEDVLDYRGALYQRPTLVLRLAPFTAAQARRYLGTPDPSVAIEAYAACGGYPLHLDGWNVDRPPQENLLRLAGTPGGLLLEDGVALMASLQTRVRRVLMAVGQGRTRRGEIADDVPGDVDRPLDAAQRTRLLRAEVPLDAPLNARPLYRVADPFLCLWLRLLGNHVQLIEAGQGAAVLDRVAGEWQSHLGIVFEQVARAHAVRLVADGRLPSGTLIGEWWTTSGPPCQVDVLALNGHRTVAVGEARWQRQPLGTAEVDALAGVLQRVPKPAPQPILLLWGRGGVRPEVAVGPVHGFGPDDMLGP